MIELTAKRALELEELNDRLLMSNRELTNENEDLRGEVLEMRLHLEELRSKLERRARILQLIKKQDSRFVLSVLDFKRPKKKKSGHHDNATAKKLWPEWKEWDEIRVLINPNAKRG